MSDSAFPVLGFNPAKGNVTAVDDLSKRFNNAHLFVKDAHDTLRSIAANDHTWFGSAASAFSDKLDLLPEYLDRGQNSLGKAAKALVIWGGQLSQHQERAHGLEREAKAAYAFATEADLLAQQARNVANNPIPYDPTNPASAAAAHQTAQHNARVVEQATHTANGAWAKLDEIRRRAEKLKEQWEDDANACASSIRDACDETPSESFAESLGDIFTNVEQWFRAWGEELGDLAGAISAVAGALAFIPLLAPFAAPLALATGLVALGAHTHDFVVHEKWNDVNSYIGLLGDVAGVVPGLGALTKGFGEALEFSAKGGQAVATSRLDNFLTPIKITPETIYHGASEFSKYMAEPSKAFGWFGQKLVGDDFLMKPELATKYAKGFEAGANIGVQFPVVTSLLDPSKQGDDLRDAAGIPGALLAGITSGGRPWYLR